MAKQMKKALCVLLSVLMAFSCFAVSAFAFTGYDNNGTNNDLRVQSAISVDNTAYQVGDTVTATLTLNHPDDSVAGYQAYIAFDASKLAFQGVSFNSGFSVYGMSAPTAESVIELDAKTLHNGFGGSTYNATTFAKLLGTPNMTTLAVVHVAAINTASVAAGTTSFATLSFEALGAVSATGVAVVPSNVYKNDFGFFDSVATLSTGGVYASAFTATGASADFEITGASADVYYDITFTWNGGSQVVSTKENTMPEAPTVAGYSDGDYDYSFSAWSPELAKATAAATYVAQYSSTFVSADYEAYNAAVATAIAKRDGNDNWTDESVAALNTELNKDVSGKGRTAQSEVDAQTTAINNAADALAEKAAVYTINFVVKGETVSTQQVTAGDMPVAPSVENYEDNAKTYTFTGWDKTVVAAAGNTTYTAQFSETWKEYDITFTWNGNSTVVKTHWGDMPVAPTVPGYEDASTTYVFSGWNPTLVACAGNATYAATYAESTKTFTVRFVNEDNSVLETQTLVYGATPVYGGQTPTKAADNTYTYSFKEWSPAITAVTGDATYKATYNATYINYTVKFVDEDQTVIQEIELHYGDAIQAPANPTKAADNTYTYSFKAWSPAVPATVTGSATFTATYESTYIDYNIKFTWHDGESNVTVHYGQTPEAPTVPSYEADGKTYSFKAWNPAVTACTGEATYVAEYSSEFIVYTITFVVGEQQTTQQVNAGSMPAAPEVSNYADGDYDVTFTGWDKAIVAAAGDATYTAQFSSAFVGADYTAVNEAKLAATGIDRDIYTAESLAALDKVVGDVTEGLGRTQQAQVTAWATAINTAISELEPKPADYTAYNAAVAAVQAELQKEDYTPDSIAAVTQALATIDTGLDKELKITAQATVDTATAAVNALIAELVEKADKGDLKSLIDEATALDSNKYVDFTAVSTALSDAQTVYADDNATPKAVSDAIKALRNALNALVFKPADYTAWDALEAQFNALELRYYDQDLVAAVKTVLAKVVRDQDINYQPTLDEITLELDTAIKALDIIRRWEGETDFNGVEHDYFYSNLEFEKVSESNEELVVKVYLNHPSTKVDAIQVAALFDAGVVEFKSVEAAAGGTVVGTPAAANAQFDPTDFGYEAMSQAGVVKFMIEFDSTLAETFAGRDEIATLHFTPIASGKTILKAVPLASNTTADKSVYSAIIDDNGAEVFMHSEWVSAEFSGIIKITNIVTNNRIDNAPEVMSIKLLKNSAVISETPEDDSAADAAFNNVAEGAYSIQIEVPGSLGFVINNIIVDPANPEITIPEVKLLFGNADGDNVISAKDIAVIIGQMGKPTLTADADGDGIVAAKDIATVLLADHFGKTAASQVYTLD